MVRPTRDGDDNAVSEAEQSPEVGDPTVSHKQRSVATKRDAGSNSSNNDNNKSENLDAPISRVRPRLQSDADRRNDLEKKRESSRAEKISSSLTNNRFLSTQSAAAESEDSTPEQDAGEPQQQQDSDNDVIEDVAPSTLTVIPKTKASVAASAAGMHDSRIWKLGEHVVAYPQTQSALGLGVSRSKWTHEVQVEERCGLFVEDKREHLATIHPSTLARLEERMRREATAQGSEETDHGEISHPPFKLADLIHTRESHSTVRREVTEDGDDESMLASALRVSKMPAFDAKKVIQTRPEASETAMLEICIDRVVLDDHACFTLEDRICAQLRSMYTTYGRLQQQQPWWIYLERIDKYVDAYCNRATMITDAAAQWETQTIYDSERALDELTKLQHLHQQLNTKWNELQECYRQSGRATTPSYSMKIVQRDEPISLTRVQAFVEILADENKMTEDGRTSHGDTTNKATQVAHFAKRVEVLQVQDQCLRQVLRLDNQHHGQLSGIHGDTASASTFSRGSRRQQHPLPRMYVAVYVNDKQAFVTTTREMSCDPHHPRGLVLFDETFYLKVPYFPDSISATVLEQRFLYRSVISTASVPMILPGQGDSHSSSANSRLSVASLSPSYEWYQFSSTTSIARSRWHRSFRNSSLYSNFVRHPHGRICVKTAWVRQAIAKEEGALASDDVTSCFLPPKRPPIIRALLQNDKATVIGTRYTGGSTRHTRQGLDKSRFSYEHDFLVHIKALDKSLDPNDPDNTSTMRLQEHLRSQSDQLTTRSVFRTSSLAYCQTELLRSAPFVTSIPLTKRNMLLQMRDQEHSAKHGTSFIEAAACRRDNNRGGIDAGRWQHEVFEEPVPLEESELTADERYLSLLRSEVKDFDHRLRVEDAEEGAVFSVERQHKLNLLKIHDFIDRVKQNQLVAEHKVIAKDKHKTLASIIQEQPLPLFPGTIDFSAIGNLFAPRRRLRPKTARRFVPNALAEWPNCCDVYIQVQKGTNVPVRLKQRDLGSPRWQELNANRRSSSIQKQRGGRDGGADDDDRDKPSNKVHALKQTSDYESQIFVEVCFQGKKRRTSCSLLTGRSSSNPVWMETLVVPFRPPLDDWSPDSIQRCQDEIRINLFDQVIVAGEDDGEQFGISPDDKNDVGSQVRSFHQENYFLGGICIPFTTLYHNSGSLEAMLRCDMPIEHLGYVNLKSDADGPIGIDTPRSSADDMTPRQVLRSPLGNDDVDEGEIKKSSREATFVSVMMTLDPLLPLPVKMYEPAIASLGSHDTSDSNKRLANYATDWMLKTQHTNSATKCRNFRVFARNLSNGNSFLSQYIGVQQPPRVGPFSASKITLQMLVRFVRLIPFLDDWHLFDGEKDIWSTSQEFLGINAGDHEEHAVLLCNFFHWLDRNDPNLQNYLVIGRAVPEGESVYVLRQDVYKIPQRSVLWNASTGVGYHVWDERCPMQDVSLVVSSENIFANVQQTQRFRDLTWDVETNAKAWKPFFHPTTIQRDKFVLPCVQVRALAFEETSSEYVASVEMEIRETLKLEIRRWRSSRSTTTFNIDVGMRLRVHLEHLERHMQGDQTRSEDADRTASVLLELQQTKDISGMPLNLTFTDLQKVVELVRNTNIHRNERANVEFALAVYVCGYPNCILSVWVYFVSLVLK